MVLHWPTVLPLFGWIDNKAHLDHILCFHLIASSTTVPVPVPVVVVVVLVVAVVATTIATTTLITTDTSPAAL